MGYKITHPLSGQQFYVSTRYMLDNRFHGGRRTHPRHRKFIVVHHTAGNTAGDLKVLRGKTASHVSVKYLVPDPQDGHHTITGKLRIYQLLPHDVVGWSVGRTEGPHGNVDNENSDSIEVSNLGNGKDVFEQIQQEAVEALVAYEEQRLGQDVLVFAHREIAPGRKVDPHPSFPLAAVKKFARLVRRGKK